MRERLSDPRVVPGFRYSFRHGEGQCRRRCPGLKRRSNSPGQAKGLAQLAGEVGLQDADVAQPRDTLVGRRFQQVERDCRFEQRKCIELQAELARIATFEEVWRTVRDRFYDPHLHGLDWSAVRKIVVGGRVPADVELEAVPADWGPSLTKYRYVYSGDRVMLVDPGADRRSGNRLTPLREAWPLEGLPRVVSLSSRTGCAICLQSFRSCRTDPHLAARPS